LPASEDTIQKTIGSLGHQLHDKFMIAALCLARHKRSGRRSTNVMASIQLEWLAPHSEEFRFPHYGRKKIDNMRN